MYFCESNRISVLKPILFMRFIYKYLIYSFTIIFISCEKEVEPEQKELPVEIIEYVLDQKLPTSDFKADIVNTLVGQQISFSNLSGNKAVSWLWDFGDGNTTTERNPFHIYKQAGQYTVSLISTNPYGSVINIKEASINIAVDPEISTLTDADGNLYLCKQIGTQIWMIENLRTTRYKDGQNIQNTIQDDDWSGSTNPAYCWYDNSNYYKKYGALYNWYAVGTNKLAPAGWHVPTKDEWQTLIDFLGGSYQTVSYIENLNFPINAGIRESSDGDFDDLNSYGYYWTSTEYGDDRAFSQKLSSSIYSSRYYKSNGMSIRCIKD